MMNNNNVVKLNDAEMEKVFGGCEQHGLLTPMHTGYTNQKRPQERDTARA